MLTCSRSVETTLVVEFVVVLQISEWHSALIFGMARCISMRVRAVQQQQTWRTRALNESDILCQLEAFVTGCVYSVLQMFCTFSLRKAHFQTFESC